MSKPMDEYAILIRSLDKRKKKLQSKIEAINKLIMQVQVAESKQKETK